ncbi:MAG: tRNA (adenosine(37)-N6)-threonylcarbamoyltransferase complex dimerization subunit type 1 TsaB [Xanthomonadales bacterium]|nr:tRNA (adenosine(37)-N6)-threonylcarbamoyltransferase complex dimerization subunit type 1 TsaB [Xanthomonadales bacterium]
MILLALDTSTEACSAALWVEGRIIERFEVAPRKHAELLLPMIDELLLEADLPRKALDAVVFGRGPGSFTGVRLAASVAQGLAFGLGKPVIPLSSLAALAQAEADEHPGHPIAAMIDARMGEIYLGLFRSDEDGLVVALNGERVIPPEQVRLSGDQTWRAVGSGWNAYARVLQTQLGDRVDAQTQPRYPRAAALLKLAQREAHSSRWQTPEHAQPLYLRDKVALTVVERMEQRRAAAG